MKRTISVIFAILLFAAAVFFHTEISAAITAAGIRCVTILIPSLYLCSVLAAFFVRSGILEYIAIPLHKCSRKFLHMDGDVLIILLFSQIAGYPVGAQLLRQMQEKDATCRTEMLLPVCFGCGPAFLTGTVCVITGMPPAAVGVLFLSIILPNLLLALVLAWRMDLRRKESLRPMLSLHAQTFTASVESGASAMLKICSMVLVFSAVMGMAEGVSAKFLDAQSLPEIAASILEISNITEYLRNGGSLPMAAALLSFGGICVHLQNVAIFGEKFPWNTFWRIRIPAAVCTYGICHIGLAWLYDGTSQPAFLSANPYHPMMTAESIVPSICLLVMSFLLLQKQEQQ